MSGSGRALGAAVVVGVLVAGCSSASNAASTTPSLTTAPNTIVTSPNQVATSTAGTSTGSRVGATGSSTTHSPSSVTATKSTTTTVGTPSGGRSSNTPTRPPSRHPAPTPTGGGGSVSTAAASVIADKACGSGYHVVAEAPVRTGSGKVWGMVFFALGSRGCVVTVKTSFVGTKTPMSASVQNPRHHHEHHADSALYVVVKFRAAKGSFAFSGTISDGHGHTATGSGREIG